MPVAAIVLDGVRYYNRQDPLGFGTCDMRVSKQKAAENHEQILLAASRLLRKCGISGAGVARWARPTGMTPAVFTASSAPKSGWSKRR